MSVGLLVDARAAEIATEGAYEIHSKADSRLLSQSKQPLKATFRPVNGGIEANGQIYPERNLILTVTEGSIQVGKRRYGHRIQILKKSDHAITVINELSFEEYLKGVLPLEVHYDWPLEALKAHAVISRTFALFKALEKKDHDFSLRDTVESQVYGGMLFHKPSTDQAVDSTRGEILVFGGKIFPSYFHAACGGKTARADHVWPVQPNPVLNGVDCDFCKSGKHWKWVLKIGLREIETLMQKRGYPAKNLKRIIFLDRDESGRATKVKLEYQRSKLVLPAADFRTFIGYDRLKSLKANVEIKKGGAYFQGYGWGHGAGFCQWGAKGQAELGRSYLEILQFYFPGSEIKKI